MRVIPRATLLAALISGCRATDSGSERHVAPAGGRVDSGHATARGADAANNSHEGSTQLAELRVELSASLEALDSQPEQAQHLRSPALVRSYYRHRQGVPAWLVGAAPGARVEAAVAAIEALESDGLRPDDYLAAIRSLNTGEGWQASAQIELALTDALLNASTHLLHGRVDPVEIHPEWTAARRDTDLFRVLDDAAASGDFAGLVAELRPRPPEYERLRSALARYRGLVAEGEWEPIAGPAPVDFARDARQRVRLAQRLTRTGDLPHGETAVASLREALRAFQRRHGHSPTGELDERTRQSLNVPAARRVAQLEANLERWRWLPNELGVRHVRVNIAGYEVRVFAEGQERLQMRAVVGKTYRRTPVYSGELTELVLNPRWSVPHKLAVRDVLPKVQEDPGYLARNGIRVFSVEDGREREVDGASVDWRGLSSGRFPYKLRQNSGKENALGRIKFVFDNPYDVYLHDTPKRGAFSWDERALSSGCVRLERPLALAAFLLEPAPEWSEAALEKALATGQTRTVRLPEPVPVHLLYKTAWVDDAGGVNFRKDLYGRDAALIEALATVPPLLSSSPAD